MMDRFESKWFIAIIGNFIDFVGKSLVIFISVQQSKFTSCCNKKTKQQYIVLQDALFLLLLSNNFKKIRWSENNFNRFYDKTNHC